MKCLFCLGVLNSKILNFLGFRDSGMLPRLEIWFKGYVMCTVVAHFSPILTGYGGLVRLKSICHLSRVIRVGFGFVSSGWRVDTSGNFTPNPTHLDNQVIHVNFNQFIHNSNTTYLTRVYLYI